MPCLKSLSRRVRSRTRSMHWILTGIWEPLVEGWTEVVTCGGIRAKEAKAEGPGRDTVTPPEEAKPAEAAPEAAAPAEENVVEEPAAEASVTEVPRRKPDNEDLLFGVCRDDQAFSQDNRAVSKGDQVVNGPVEDQVPPTKATCPNGHSMVHFVVAKDGRCGKYTTIIPVGGTVMRCRECAYFQREIEIDTAAAAEGLKTEEPAAEAAASAEEAGAQ